MKKEFNKCEECGYLHGCHKFDCSKVNSPKKENKSLSEHRQESSSLTEDGETMAFFYLEGKVKEFIKNLKEKIFDAQQYADMDDPDFWATSTISPEEAQKRADYLAEFEKDIDKLAGPELT